LALGVPGSVVVKDMIYISTNSNGVYSSKDGIKWQNESLPNPDGNEYPLEFGSIAAGNNKIIVEARMHRNKKLIGVIYTKDLKTNSWSYQVYPETVHNITRGKDRFVGLTETSSLVLVDGSHEWESYPLAHPSYALTYGLDNSFLAISNIQKSVDGIEWNYFEPSNENLEFTTSVACSKEFCVAVSDNYQMVKLSDNSIDLIKFNHKNPPRKLGWYDRLLNRIFFTKN